MSRWRGIVFVGWWGQRWGWTCRRCQARSRWPGVEGGHHAALAEAIAHCHQGAVLKHRDPQRAAAEERTPVLDRFVAAQSRRA